MASPPSSFFRPPPPPLPPLPPLALPPPSAGAAPSAAPAALPSTSSLAFAAISAYLATLAAFSASICSGDFDGFFSLSCFFSSFAMILFLMLETPSDLGCSRTVSYLADDAQVRAGLHGDAPFFAVGS